MDIQIKKAGDWVTVERNADITTPEGAIKQLVNEMYGATEYKVILTEAEILKKRAVSYRNESDSSLLELLCDEVLPELSAQLSSAVSEKLNACLAARQTIKQRYPKQV